MTRIGLLSDTHHYLDDLVFTHFAACDEIWHGGDFGNFEVAKKLMNFKPLRGVYGNIDGQDIRAYFPLQNHFTVEEVPVFMQHIGGYPGRYAKGVKEEIISAGAKIFVSGHSHILKIMYDSTLSCLHMNPGAAGKQGWHKVRTLVRFVIEKADIRECEVIELPGR